MHICQVLLSSADVTGNFGHIVINEFLILFSGGLRFVQAIVHVGKVLLSRVDVALQGFHTGRVGRLSSIDFVLHPSNVCSDLSGITSGIGSCLLDLGSSAIHCGLGLADCLTLRNNRITIDLTCSDGGFSKFHSLIGLFADVW